MDKRNFSGKIIEWYQANKRELPWRQTRDPYKIWLSEVILQQTRVAQGLPYYERFVSRFPTVAHLAAADEQEVLRLWQGLGYYTRARNLHKCARTVVNLYRDRFPSAYADLIQLPGIGEYTAAAIASFAAREPVAVVDGNVFRVLSRIYGIADPINTPEGKRRFTALANGLLDSKRPDDHNQAMMEFGALWCLPKNPDCHHCIFHRSCVARAQHMVSTLPVKLKARKSKRRYFYYFVLQHNETILMQRREGKDIWHGLYDFPLVEKTRPVKLEKILDEIGWATKKSLQPVVASRSYKHVLSHQTIFSRFIVMQSKKSPFPVSQPVRFYDFKQIHDLPKPVLVNRFLEDYYLS